MKKKIHSNFLCIFVVMAGVLFVFANSENALAAPPTWATSWYKFIKNHGQGDTTPPQVSITSPSTNTSFSSAQTVTIIATASDDGSISKVEFYDGSTLRGTDTSAPYTYSWPVTAADNGQHNFIAMAYDENGNSRTSQPDVLVVSIASSSTGGAADSTPPTVSITSPSTNTTYTSAQTVTVAASASDNVGVARVEFYDGSTLKGTDTSAPFTYSWAVSSSANGTHSFTARAYDAAGNSSASSPDKLVVNIPLPDTTAPTVSISSPASNTTYTSAQTVTVTASTSDNVGVAKVEFYDGSTLKGTDTSAPFNYSWAVSSSANGTHSFTAKAYDAAGNSSTSNPDTLVVNIPLPDTIKPTIFISSPANGAVFSNAMTVNVAATAQDNVGVTKVEFFDGTKLLGTDTSSPYALSWPISGADNGAHVLTCKAYDAAGNTQISNPVSLSVAITSSTGSNSSSGFTFDVSLAWDKASNPNVAGYKIYYKTGSNSLPFDGSGAIEGPSPIDLRDATSVTLTGLPDGKVYYFTVTAYDFSGNESSFSNIVSTQ